MRIFIYVWRKHPSETKGGEEKTVESKEIGTSFAMLYYLYTYHLLI